jgi:hypothetical protein
VELAAEKEQAPTFAASADATAVSNSPSPFMNIAAP